jgi:hypothetical protein
MFGVVFVIMGLIMVGSIVMAIMDADADYFFGGLGICGIIVAVTVVFTIAASGINNQHWNGQSYSLQAINTGTGTSGHFFLGSGGFGSDAKFYAYVGNGDGSLTLRTFDADKAKVVETANTTPKVIYQCSDWITPKWVSWPTSFATTHYNCSTDEADSVTFYVPPNSITNKIKLALPGS